MSITENKEVFYDFLTEYTDFFKGMASFEQQKLEVLLENHLPEIEHAISVTQANAMQLDNLENKRIRLQSEAGLSQMSLSQLAETAPENSRGKLQNLVGELNSYIRDIKFYNSKSMHVVQVKLRMQEHAVTRRTELHERTSAPIKLETKA